MLDTTQKANILRRTGVDVPSPPQAAEGIALAAWTATIERLFVGYAAARAAKSLRDAEEVRQLDRLRRMAVTPSKGQRTEWIAQ